MPEARRKVWKLDPESKTGMMVTSERASMVASSASGPNAVMVGKEGTWISGPLSILTMPNEIRIGGFWVMQNPFLGMFPSTMATPIPQFVLSPPISGIANMAEAVSWAMTFLV